MREIPYMEVPEKPGVGVSVDEERLAKYHELYIKEIYEKGLERGMRQPRYSAMFMRDYFNDVQA